MLAGDCETATGERSAFLEMEPKKATGKGSFKAEVVVQSQIQEKIGKFSQFGQEQRGRKR